MNNQLYFKAYILTARGDGLLVGIIAAIVVIITHPHARDAPAVIARELAVRVAGARLTLRIERRLIALILAIHVAVTRPRARNTLAVTAPELPGFAHALRACVLVRGVAAVVGAVADLEGEGAVEVGALELTGRAVTYRCKYRSVCVMYDEQ